MAAADGSESGPPATIEHYVRQQDVAAHRARAELVHAPRPQSRRRPGWAVAAGHTPDLDTLQYWNEQWLHTAHWYDDPRFDDDAEAQAWRVVEAHAAGLSRPQGKGTRHMCSDTDDYIPSYPRPAWEDVSFDPEDGDIFDEWLNGGDDGRQEAAWEAAIAVWDRDFHIGQGRQKDRMFCVTEYMLRMPHGDSYSNDAAWMVILADVLFFGVREADWLRRIIARRISAAARRRWRSPSAASSAEAAKRRRRYDGNDPDGAGSGGKVLQAAFVSLRSVPLRRNHTGWPAGWQTAGAGRKQSTSLRRHTGGVDPKSGSSRLFLDAYHDTQERASLLCGVLRQESIYRAHLTPLAQRSQ